MREIIDSLQRQAQIMSWIDRAQRLFDPDSKAGPSNRRRLELLCDRLHSMMDENRQGLHTLTIWGASK